MKIPTAALALSLTLSLITAPAIASEAQDAAIAALGEISGISLACKQPAIVSQARNAVATTVHKSRVNGEIFENANNDAFLEQGKGKVCPTSAQLAERLHIAEKNLSTAFATK